MGMTVAAFQSLGIGVATMAVDSFINRGSRLVVTVLPSLRAVGSWEEVLLFSMDFTVSQNLFQFVLQDVNFCLIKLAFAFLT